MYGRSRAVRRALRRLPRTRPAGECGAATGRGPGPGKVRAPATHTDGGGALDLPDDARTSGMRRDVATGREGHLPVAVVFNPGTRTSTSLTMGFND
ncbi:hypothetical protein GCM10010306_098870 [Streptomyces umbrinus]|nr:hypothetical protein GCM10010306_098870 [Streptomyces umbrinus]